MPNSNLTKMVDALLKGNAALLQDLEVHGAGLPARVAVWLGEPRAEAALETLFAATGAAVRRRVGHLQVADHAYLVEQSDDQQLRDKRDAAARELYTGLTSVRSLINSVYGPAAVRALGFVGDTPVDPVALSRLVPVVLEKLATLPQETTRVAVDLGGLHDDLAAKLTPLAHALDALARDGRENEVALRARNEGIGELERSTSFLKQLLVLAATVLGDADLAYRVKGAGASPKTPDVPLTTTG